MCGICGFISFNNNHTIDKDVLVSMNDLMKHRGPDDSGIYLGAILGNNKFKVGLGHRRLSIIDLSVLGHQPMTNEDATIWIVYNGEIYNFLELRELLIGRGHIFKSHTDTEVIIHMYEEFGTSCIDHFRGMFAFALWDEKNKVLFAARDRLGKKPFYYYVYNNMLIFASEAKSILKSGKIDANVNRNVIDFYLTLGYVPAPQTMFERIYKLLPGHMLIFSENEFLTKQYWDIDSIGCVEDKGEKFYIDQFLGLMDECVRMRLVSDVPLGVFLSGGIDSSTITGMMSQLSKTKPVKTFCVGYKDKQASELAYAKIMAKRFGTDHHEFLLEPTDFYEFIPKLVWHFDEPVVEAAAIPLYFISELAREHVAVLLSGEGADELFAGYPIYRYMNMIDKYRKIPHYARKYFFDQIIKCFISSRKKRSKYLDWTQLPLEQRYFGVSAELTDSFKGELYSHDFRNFIDDKASVQDYLLPYYNKASNKDSLGKMLYVDTKVWLPDDLLIKADKMSMAASVELRVPFLDHKLVEFAATVPSKYKIKKWTSKYLLKKAVRNLLPKEIIYRRKKGFPVPINAWFKGDFSEKAQDTLLNGRNRGYFDNEYVAQIIKKHKEGKEDYSKQLFSLIVLEMWHKVFIDGK